MMGKAVKMEQEEMAVARQRRGKHVSASTDSDETMEYVVFSMLSLPRLYSEDQQSRQGLRKLEGSQSCWRAKFGHESCGTWNQEPL
jgi:hypothetical protein